MPELQEPPVRGHREHPPFQPGGFVHLRMHTEYSILDGIVRPDQAVRRAVADGQVALGISDLGNTFGLIKFYSACRRAGIKPVMGVDVFVTNQKDRDSPFRLLLIAQNELGYRNLCELVSRSWLTNSYRDRGEIQFDWFSEQNAAQTAQLHQGLICLSGAGFGQVGKTLSQAGYSAAAIEVATQVAKQYKDVFGDRYYIEVQRAGFDQQEELLAASVAVATKAGIPVVATHPVQFLKPEDFTSHEARVCIARGDTLANPKRSRDFTDQQYLKTQQEMTELFADLPVALANAQQIAARCNLILSLGVPRLPNFPTPDGVGLDQFLRDQSLRGLEQRLAVLFPVAQDRSDQRPKYLARLQLECDMIIAMGFPGYFLIVADFINWAKRNGVPVGPGRGSGAGSLVAYSLGITDLDPLPYALLFERFLNPERVSMPDFDIDFCQEKRHLVIDYVRSKYGSDAVSQIVTFGTMASRAVIRDAGRVLDLPYNFCDQLSKLIPVVQNKPLSLQEARDKEPILADREKKEDEVRELLALAEPLEDLTRNVGMHAGGVLIAPGRLTDFCPLYQAPGSEGSDGIVSMYDKDDVEAAGLVKFDFLGLRNLTILQLAVDTINRLYPSRQLRLEDLSGFDDPAAYQVLKQANTTAIFQVESQGMKRYLLKLQPDTFEDIIAMLALYRPGPLNSGMVDDFILRKQGQQRINYFHDDLKDCLAPTYGVIVYQEQVMQIAQIIAGYTLGGADLLRRAMGKKKPEEMAQQRSIFIQGALQKGHTEKLATELFDLMEKFAEYGFNKSHTAAYAVITYQTAWLKAHFPAEFMAATLSSDMDDTDKVAFLVNDVRSNGLGVLPPDINQSHFRFEPVLGIDESGFPLKDQQNETVTRARAIRYGLGAVRGVGEPAVAEIVRARQAGTFKDLMDFCLRVDRRVVNKKAMEALIKAGAFDSLHTNRGDGRAEMLEALSSLVQLAEDSARQAQQDALFDDPVVTSSHDWLQALGKGKVPAFTDRQRLLEEKTALGYCFSGSLFDSVTSEARRFAATPLARAQPSRDPIWLAGIVTNSRAQMTRRGMMRVVELDDGSARMEVTVFNELYDSKKGLLKVDEPLIVLAKVDSDEYSGGLRGSAVEVFSLFDMRLRSLKGVQVRCQLDDSADLEMILSGVKRFARPAAPETCKVYLRVRAAGEDCQLELGSLYCVVPSDENLEDLRTVFGQDKVELAYAV